MGYEAACEVRLSGRSGPGTALLEQKTLVVRGPFRLTIPLAEVRTATADQGCLRIQFEDRVVELALGAEAARWAKRITNPPSRLDKLGIKPGMRVLVVGPMEEGFVEELRGAGATVLRRTSVAAAGKTGPVDALFYAVDRREALEGIETLVPAIVASGAIWTLRPKGSRGVSESETMAAGKRAGLVDVKVVSFSDSLTAEKFVIPVAKRPHPAPRRAGAGPRSRPGDRA